ncbi:MAG: AAA family ATPase [Patescibacteria group bacterium]|jgi:CYTH domain-containing protein/predicted ATPase
MPKETERRFILPGVTPSAVLTNPRELTQGYLNTPPHSIFRVRETAGNQFEMTTKLGHGVAREEENCELNEQQFHFIYQACPYPLAKRRADCGVWTVDTYHGPLQGLVCIEDEAAPGAPFPAWVDPALAIEVTNTVTNYDLARLARELTHNPLHGGMTVYTFLKASVEMPMDVVTGPPCSGKSKALVELNEKFGEQIHFVPEAASIIIGTVGVPFPAGDAFAIARFQQSLATIQRSFEFLAKTEAIRSGKLGVVLDRGDVDCAAYLPNGLDDFEVLTQTDRTYAYSRYSSVFCLEIPSRAIYEQHKADNLVRRESYEEACALGEAMQRVWCGHPNYTFIRNADSWEAKFETIRNAFLRKIA